jgi:hypothetical protein
VNLSATTLTRNLDEPRRRPGSDLTRQRKPPSSTDGCLAFKDVDGIFFTRCTCPTG